MEEAKKEFNKQKYDNEYIRQNFDRINFVMPKGTKDRIKAAADLEGIKASEFIRRSIEKALQEAEK